MAAKGGGGGGQEADNSLAALWITVGIFAVGGFIWYFFQEYIVAFIITIRAYEAALISLFLPSAWAQELVQAKAFINSVQSSGYKGVSITDLVQVSNQVGDYMRYPAILILGGLAFLLYRAQASSRFRRTYDMQNLLVAEAVNWPQITPVVKLDLVNEDLNQGPWAMAQSPMMFAKRNNLLIEEKFIPSDAVLKTKAIITASINRDEARKVFAMQLGSYWQGISKSPLHVQALFAAFVARIEGNREGSHQLLMNIATSTGTGKIDYSGTEELLRKHKDSKIAKMITERHAFIGTVMASMLEAARADGVLGSADFLWLKPVDRRLWFILNCVGRQTPFAEVAGIYAHWLVEKEFRRPLNVPMVEEAVNALEETIKGMIFKPDEIQ